MRPPPAWAAPAAERHPPPPTPRLRTRPCVLSWHLERPRAERDPIIPRAARPRWRDPGSFRAAATPGRTAQARSGGAAGVGVGERRCGDVREAVRTQGVWPRNAVGRCGPRCAEWESLSSALGSVGRQEAGRPAVGFRPPPLPKSPSSETPSESPDGVPAGLPARGPQFAHPRRGGGGVCKRCRVVPAACVPGGRPPPRLTAAGLVLHFLGDTLGLSALEGDALARKVSAGCRFVDPFRGRLA